MKNTVESWKHRLIEEAVAARRKAAAPYSKFKVGAALLLAGDEVVRGANVESASYGLTCCAERVAVFKAVTEGSTRIRAVAVVARCTGGPMPCGACRQVLWEYAPRAVVWIADTAHPGRIRTFRMADLLPRPFRV